LPEYGYPKCELLEKGTYQKYGDILVPPDSILSNQKYWGDENHMNIAGAKSYSQWLTKEINNMVTQ
jgi:hypothetical protein